MVVAGDFTVLANHYSKYRVGYHEDVLSAMLGMISSSPNDLDIVDVGAGTGIWTRMMAARGCRCRAVEPNAAMRQRLAKPPMANYRYSGSKEPQKRSRFLMGPVTG